MLGLKPVRNANGSPFMGDLTHYRINSENTAAIFHGDPVVLTSGYVLRTTGNTAVIGVFQGCEYADAAAPGGYRFSPNWPGVSLGAGVEVRALIADAPDLISEITFRGTTTALTYAQLVSTFGKRVNLTLGSGSGAFSTAEMGAASTTGAFFVLPISVAPYPGEGVGGRKDPADNKFLYTVQVKAMLHQLAGSVAD